MYFIIYKTTNLINNKIYIGMHKTNNLNDGYYGSGKALKRAIKKYGIENFKVDIIEMCLTEQGMIDKEQEIVTEGFCARSDTYNLMPGGSFGSKERNGLTFANHKHSEDTKRKISESAKGKVVSDASRKKMSSNNFARRNPKQQRQHAIECGRKSAAKRKLVPSDEINKKISETLTDLNRVRREKSLDHHNKGLVRHKISCPHCNKEGALNVMKRFHFDNCKLSQNSSLA